MGRAQRRAAGLTCHKRLGRVPIVPLKIVQFLALTLTALALVPSGAHLCALPNKINLVAEQYFIVQNIYRGWSLFGVALIGALTANLATNNWMMIPDNWEQLRREWEYSHAANAVVTFAALCSVALSVLTTRE